VFGRKICQKLALRSGILFASTARSVEDEARDDRRNANRNPEWWRDFSQLVEIERLKFIGISLYKFKLTF